MKIYIILVCTKQQWALHIFEFIGTLLIKNNKKREAALKNEAGGDEKHVFSFTWPNKQEISQSQLSFFCH